MHPAQNGRGAFARFRAWLINRLRPARAFPFYFSVCPYSFRSRPYSTAEQKHPTHVAWGQVRVEWIFSPLVVVAAVLIAMAFFLGIALVFTAILFTAILRAATLGLLLILFHNLAPFL